MQNDQANTAGTQGVYKNPRLMHVCTTIVGSTVYLQTKDGSVWEGVFKTFDPKFTICLDLAVQVDPKLGIKDCFFHALKSGSRVREQAFFELKDIVRIAVIDIDLSFATKDAASDKLATDSDISKSKLNKSGEHKELESWQADDGDDNIESSMLSLDEVATNNKNGGSKNNSRGWDAQAMFDYNERVHKVNTTYNEKLVDYTIALNEHNSEDWHNKHKRAAAIAKEIETNPKSQNRLAKEDGSDDEEEKFSAVVRPGQQQSQPKQQPQQNASQQQHHHHHTNQHSQPHHHQQQSHQHHQPPQSHHQQQPPQQHQSQQHQPQQHQPQQQQSQQQQSQQHQPQQQPVQQQQQSHHQPPPPPHQHQQHQAQQQQQHHHQRQPRHHQQHQPHQQQTSSQHMNFASAHQRSNRTIFRSRPNQSQIESLRNFSKQMVLGTHGPTSWQHQNSPVQQSQQRQQPQPRQQPPPSQSQQQQPQNLHQSQQQQTQSPQINSQQQSSQQSQQVTPNQAHPQNQPQTQSQPQSQPQTQSQPQSQSQVLPQPPSQSQQQLQQPQAQQQPPGPSQQQSRPHPQQQQNQQQSKQQPQSNQTQQQQSQQQQSQTVQSNSSSQASQSPAQSQSEIVKKSTLNPNAKEFKPEFKPRSPASMHGAAVVANAPTMPAPMNPANFTPMPQGQEAYYQQVPIFPHQPQHHAAQFITNHPHMHYQNPIHYMPHFAPTQQMPPMPNLPYPQGMEYAQSLAWAYSVAQGHPRPTYWRE